MTRFQRTIVAIAGLAAALVGAPPAGDTVSTPKFDEWMTPSKPPFPHDPEFSPDGSVWYTGQRANVVGRLNPQSGEFKEYPLPTPQSGPHGLTTDKDGDIWYTGNSAALIGKLDVKTGEITEYK